MTAVTRINNVTVFCPVHGKCGTLRDKNTTPQDFTVNVSPSHGTYWHSCRRFSSSFKKLLSVMWLSTIKYILPYCRSIYFLYHIFYKNKVSWRPANNLGDHIMYTMIRKMYVCMQGLTMEEESTANVKQYVNQNAVKHAPRGHRDQTLQKSRCTGYCVQNHFPIIVLCASL